MDPQYEGETIVELKSAQSPLSFGEGSAPPINSSTSVLNSLAVVSEGPAMAGRVVDRTGFEKIYQQQLEHPDQKGAAREFIGSVLKSPVTLLRSLLGIEEIPIDYRQRSIQVLRKQLLSVDASEITNVLTITVSANSSSLSNQLSNAYADELVATNKEQVRQKYTKMKSSLQLRIDVASKDLAMADSSLQDFMSDNGLADLSAQRKDTLEQISAMEQSIQLVEQRIDQLSSTKKSLQLSLASVDGVVNKSTFASTETTVERTPQVLALVQQLEDLQTTLDSNEDNLSTENYDALSSEITGILNTINDLLISINSSSETSSSEDVSNPALQRPEEIEAEIAGTRAALNTMNQQIESLRIRLRPMNEQEQALTELERNWTIANTRLIGLINDLKKIETLIEDPIPDLDLRIVDRSNLAKNAKPSFPSWGIAVVVAAVFSNMFALFVVLVLQFFNGKIITAQELRDEFGLTLIGRLDKDRSKGTR